MFVPQVTMDTPEAHIIALWNLYVQNGMNLILVIVNAPDGSSTSGAKWESQQSKDLVKSHPKRRVPKAPVEWKGLTCLLTCVLHA